jgi:hypothetical protein
LNKKWILAPPIPSGSVTHKLSFKSNKKIILAPPIIFDILAPN